MTVGLFAVIAQHEREAICQRTKDALKAKNARGAQLDTPANLTEEVRQLGLEARQRNARKYGRFDRLRHSSWPGGRRGSAVGASRGS